ncbi:hypothetical protein FOA52_004424 [Chlamydomonas sp. UWO 241]|nr:hypothetical protein FOA52_004424 [Chlamydomonas sp. UWO 241]
MSGGLKLRWEEPAECFNAPVTEYVVQVAPRDAAANGGTDGSDNCGGSSERAWRAAYAVASPSARVSDLAPNTAYVVRVRAANAAGAGPWSEELVAMTALLPPGPPEVACLVACGMGSGGAAPPAAAAPGASDAWVVLSWAPPAHAPDCAQAVSFEVAATAVTARPASVAAASEPAASVAVVAASGAAADGGDHHRAPPPPEPHRASATGAGMMERAASSSLYAPPAAAAPAARLTVGKGVGEARLEGLARGSNYAVRVRSVGAEGAGHGAWSPEMLVSTPGEPPAVDHATGGVAVGAGLGAAGGTAGTAGHGAKGGKKGNKGGGGGGKNGGVGGGAGGAAASSRSSEDGPSSLPGGRKGSNGAVPGVDGSGGSSSSGGAPAAVSIQRKSKVLAACSAAPAAGLPPKPRTGLSAAVANSRLYREHLRRPLRMLFVLSIPVARGANWFLAGGGRRMDEEEATAAAAERIAAAAEDGTSLPVRLATDVVRFLYGGTGRREPADGGVVSASLLNAKPAVGGIGVEPRGGGVLRVLFTVASDAVADTVVDGERVPAPAC